MLSNFKGLSVVLDHSAPGGSCNYIAVMLCKRKAILEGFKQVQGNPSHLITKGRERVRFPHAALPLTQRDQM